MTTRVGSNIIAQQNAAVLDHLLHRGPLDPQQALYFYGVFRLAARIYDLRQIGHLIHTGRIKNDHGNPYARYTLLKQAGHDPID